MDPVEFCLCLVALWVLVKLVADLTVNVRGTR